jgi:putative RNA 2'-phosphotransferase
MGAYNKGIIDRYGWRDTEEIIQKYGFTFALLNKIVLENNKHRYEFNSDYTRIRARQGHSIPVDVELNVANNISLNNPYLWHGTSDKYIENIKLQGLLSGKRLYVHLSGDEKTAYDVGKRHGGHVCIICIDAYQMILDGLVIYISNNGTYNTKSVAPKYFVKINQLIE